MCSKSELNELEEKYIKLYGYYNVENKYRDKYILQQMLYKTNYNLWTYKNQKLTDLINECVMYDSDWWDIIDDLVQKDDKVYSPWDYRKIFDV